jgi:hypothetical protein
MLILSDLRDAEHLALRFLYIVDNLDQATLWQGSTTAKTSADPAYSYTYLYPLAYASSYARGLALSGFSWDVNLDIAFTAVVLPGSPTTSDII